MKHTPGPWRLFTAASGKVIAVMAADSDKEVVAWSGFDSSDFPKDRKANARLIAAAPELLEACKSVVETTVTAADHCAVCGGDVSRNQHVSGCVVLSVHVAIKKAGGK